MATRQILIDPCDDALCGALADLAAANDAFDGDLGAETRLLADHGWLTACLPPAAGGEGWGTAFAGTAPALIALRAVGRASLPAGRLFEGHMNAVKLLALHAAPAIADEVFAAVRKGALLGVWGADEPGHPVVAASPDAAACYRVGGAKRYASGLGLVAQAVVTLRTGDGVRLAVVRADDPDRFAYHSWRMAGMQATQSGTFELDGMAVPAAHALGEPEVYYAEPYFDGGIWRYCAVQLGGAEMLYGAMCEALVAAGRHDDPHQRRRIAKAAIAIEGARLWIERAAYAVEAEGAGPESATLSLLARDETERVCRLVSTIVEQALGMAAHVAGSAVERMRRDLALFLCQAAPDAKLDRAARHLLEEGIRPEIL